MPPAPPDPWLNALLLMLVGASLGTWLILMKRWTVGPVLAYEPRRPVPWGAVGPLLLLLFVISRIASVVMGEEPPELDSIQQIAGNVFAQLLLFGTFFAAIAVVSQATWRDIGLPDCARQFLRDVKIGCVAWLAAIVPVYGLQALLVTASDEQSTHPLIEIVMKEPNALVLVFAFASAVVVAPLCEEVAFRLLLQGWLEKVEDRLLGWRQAPSPLPMVAAGETVPVEVAPAEPVAVVPTEPQVPPARGLFGLPHGWLPILVSAVFFAAAHMGHGPDPIPLFVLALILGYMYQRTHRIVPCIVTHLLFNFTTLLMLVLTIVFGGELP